MNTNILKMTPNELVDLFGDRAETELLDTTIEVEELASLCRKMEVNLRQLRILRPRFNHRSGCMAATTQDPGCICK